MKPRLFMSPRIGPDGQGLGVMLGIMEPEAIALKLSGSPMDGKTVMTIKLDTADAVDKAALMLQLAMKGQSAEMQAIIMGTFLESLNHPPSPMADRLNADNN